MFTASPPGVALTHVECPSTAWSSGLRPGDRIIEVKGLAMDDALAVTFALASASAPVVVTVSSPDGRRRLRVREPDALLESIRLEAIVPRRCGNDCVYCFCAQNPPGARASLLFRDEDYRMSFLAGAYVTLSALSDTDLARIQRDRLSPLYVTVQATDETLRMQMLGVRRARPLLETLHALVRADITLHAQVVVCPGLNDGVALECTLAALDRLRPGLASVVLVPVGTTRYTPNPLIRRATTKELLDLVETARRWRRVPPGEVPWVHASDEVYLGAGRPLPGCACYGDFAQLTTGVGMTRRFLEDARRVGRRRAPRWWRRCRLVLVTGTLFAPVLSRIVGRLNQAWGAQATVLEVHNEFFGPSVTVAGLLGGRETAAALRGVEADVVVLPGPVLAAEEAHFLDDMEFADLETTLGMHVMSADLLSEAFDAAGERLA